jgi:hypothetical protein
MIGVTVDVIDSIEEVVGARAVGKTFNEGFQISLGAG